MARPLRRLLLAASLVVVWSVSITPSFAQSVDVYYERFNVFRGRYDGLTGSCGKALTNSNDAQSIALDLAADKIYIGRNNGTGNSKISRYDLSGTQSEPLLTTIDPPMGLALDTANDRMYWIAPDSGVWRSTLGGASVTNLVPGSSLSGFGAGIVLDGAGGKMYFVSSFALYRANLDGSGLETLASGLYAGYDVALDLLHGHVYWTEDANGLIRRAALDGSGPITVLSYPDARGIDLDASGGKIYFTSQDIFQNGIYRINLNGTGFETLNGPGINGPGVIRIDPVPRPCDICNTSTSISKPQVKLSKLGTAGAGKIQVHGVAAYPGALPFPPLNVSSVGMRVRLVDRGAANAIIIDSHIPGGYRPTTCGDKDGWKSNSPLTSHKYSNQSNTLPPACLSGSALGVYAMQATDKTAVMKGVPFKMKGKAGSYGPIVGPLELVVQLGGSSQCASHVFPAASCQLNGGVTVETCK